MPRLPFSACALLRASAPPTLLSGYIPLLYCLANNSCNSDTFDACRAPRSAAARAACALAASGRGAVCAVKTAGGTVLNVTAGLAPSSSSRWRASASTTLPRKKSCKRRRSLILPNLYRIIRPALPASCLSYSHAAAYHTRCRAGTPLYAHRAFCAPRRCLSAAPANCLRRLPRACTARVPCALRTAWHKTPIYLASLKIAMRWRQNSAIQVSHAPRSSYRLPPHCLLTFAGLPPFSPLHLPCLPRTPASSPLRRVLPAGKIRPASPLFIPRGGLDMRCLRAAATRRHLGKRRFSRY